MGNVPDLGAYPLYDHFLSDYLAKTKDVSNFPPHELPDVLQRYEDIFASALQVLGLTKETLKHRSEFNFDSGDAANLESGIAVLRVVEALRLEGFLNITLVPPKKNAPAADITCEKNGHKVCCEVKTVTKQSSGRQGFFFDAQLYDKIWEIISKARAQLEATAAELQCAIKIFVCVINWFDQSIYLIEADYQQIVNRLEKNQDQESLKGIDGVLFVTKIGQRFLFLNEDGKSLNIGCC